MMDTVSREAIRSDFDRLARLQQDGWDHNSAYHDYLLRQLPARCAQALEIGCGAGAFARLLAARAGHVLALDFSPEMIRVACERSTGHKNIDYQVVDITEWGWPAGRFDCIASIATLHHLPLEETLSRMRHALRQGGVILVLDLYRAEGLRGCTLSALACPVNMVLRLVKTGRFRDPEPLRAAWAAHAPRDAYATLAQIHCACTSVLPGARVRRHWFWRYSIVWQKP